jgi:signal transduction histidine kinase
MSPVESPGFIAEAHDRLRRSPMALDVLLAVGLTALSLVVIAGGARDLGSYDPVSLVLLVLQTLPLVFRRQYPLVVLAVAAGATVVHAALAAEALNATLGFLVALYTVGERVDRRSSSLAALATGLAIGSVIALRAPMPAALSGFVQTELAIFVAWVLGNWSRDRRTHIETIEERARRLENEREERAERAVVAERERIARELHDVVAHHVSVIVIQAGAALRALDRRPTDARAAVEAIDATGRQALGDMRRMLGILGRAGGDGQAGTGGGSAEALAPMPSLDRLGELLEQVHAVGLPVELSVAGEPRPLEPGLELSAYRIIQEALTNVLKHAPGSRARIAVRYGPSTLEVEIVDQGPGKGRTRPMRAFDESGHGLIGMRERVAVFGGTFEASPVGRGFRVAVTLPLGAASSAAVTGTGALS